MNCNKVVHASDWGSETTLCGKHYKDFSNNEGTTCENKFIVNCEECRKKMK